jgi:hypothetical protein
MKPQTALWSAVALLAVTALAGGERLPVIKGDNSRPLVAVWREDWSSLAKDLGPFLIAAFWPDGRTVWSKDNVMGGPPYYQGRISPEVLDKTLRELESEKVFSAPYARLGSFGPDSFFTAIYLSYRGNTFLDRSWHEIAERNPKMVATSRGIVALDGKTRDQVLAGDTEDYLKYRALWKGIRAKLASLLPAKGAEAPVEFELREIELAAPAGPGKPPR